MPNPLKKGKIWSEKFLILSISLEMANEFSQKFFDFHVLDPISK